MTYEPHELCLAFPDMPEIQYQRLVADIRANGLIHEITLYEDKILDGRHRYRACLDAGIEPTFTTYHGADPVAFVTSENASRRHLTESQLAYAVSAMAPYEERKARERQKANLQHVGSSSPVGDNENGRTVEKLAQKAGIGERSVSRAIKVRKHGTEEIKHAVESGDMKLNMAEKVVTLNPTQQKAIAEAPHARRQQMLTDATRRSETAKNRTARAGTSRLPEPGTPFVRKFLSGMESLMNVCALDGAKDGSSIADKFIAEMDWDHPGLFAQLERVEPLARALAIVVQHANRKAA